MLKKSFSLQLRLSFVCFLVAIIPNPANAQQARASSFKAQLMNIEAASNEVFRYQTTLHNGLSVAQTYELNAELPDGWLISFKVNGSQVRSVQVEGGQEQPIQIEINASQSAEPKKYTLPISAQSSGDTLNLSLEAVVKGSYALQFTTPSGRLSEEVVSGSSETIQLTVKNIGTLPLNELAISSQLPAKWEATFEPSTVEQLEAGKSAEITATLKVPEKTIAGDYVANFTAKNANDQQEISFRVLVKTSVLSGWIGIVVILAAVGLVYFLIRKYGRR
ncbi:COG1470 family protein [Parapedobacter pyrenivorans]|uniref:COG1470 family protein n=1 Tax=Parapedobacter pyrenivorans TaxID=1305674 RepID=UPI003342DB5B